MARKWSEARRSRGRRVPARVLDARRSLLDEVLRPHGEAPTDRGRAPCRRPPPAARRGPDSDAARPPGACTLPRTTTSVVGSWARGPPRNGHPTIPGLHNIPPQGVEVSGRRRAGVEPFAPISNAALTATTPSGARLACHESRCARPRTQCDCSAPTSTMSVLARTAAPQRGPTCSPRDPQRRDGATSHRHAPRSIVIDSLALAGGAGSSPLTCAGCCDASGTCQSGTVNTAGGQNGALCNDCASAGIVCRDRACAVAGDGSTSTTCLPSLCGGCDLANQAACCKPDIGTCGCQLLDGGPCQ